MVETNYCLLIDKWPVTAGCYILLLIDVIGNDKPTPHMACMESASHAYLLWRFLESQGLHYESKDPLKPTPFPIPKPLGRAYASVGMGFLEVRMDGESLEAIAAGFSQTYGLAIKGTDQMQRLIDSHRQNGVQLPNYRVLVWGTEVYRPEN